MNASLPHGTHSFQRRIFLGNPQLEAAHYFRLYEASSEFSYFGSPFRSENLTNDQNVKVIMASPSAGGRRVFVDLNAMHPISHKYIRFFQNISSWIDLAPPLHFFLRTCLIKDKFHEMSSSDILKYQFKYTTKMSLNDLPGFRLVAFNILISNLI